MTTKNLVPRANGEGSIGTSLKNWNKIYTKSLYIDNVLLGTENSMASGLSLFELEIPSISWKNLETTYAVCKDIRFKDLLLRQIKGTVFDNKTLIIENHLCILVVKFYQNRNITNNANIIAQISIPRGPSSEMTWGSLKFYPDGKIDAVGQHTAGSTYYGYLYYTYDSSRWL